MPENKTALSLDLGLQTFSFESGLGKTELTFNPTDTTMLSSVLATIDLLEEKQKEYEQESQSIRNNKEFGAFSAKIDREMREIIDSAFHGPVSQEMFGYVNVHAFCANGIPVWCNFVFMVLDLFDDSMQTAQNNMSPALQKYLSKYKKKK